MIAAVLQDDMDMARAEIGDAQNMARAALGQSQQRINLATWSWGHVHRNECRSMVGMMGVGAVGLRLDYGSMMP
jgi:hypothetical protein